MRRSSTSVLSVLLVVGLAGCTARTNLTELRPVSGDLRSYTNLWISVEPNVAEDVEKERVELQDQIISDLASRNLFTLVGVDDGTRPEEGTLVIKVLISDIKRVGATKRVLIGAFAGRAKIVTDVQFVDGSTGEELGSYSVVGESGGTGMSGGTGDAVNQATKTICELVRKLRTGAGT